MSNLKLLPPARNITLLRVALDAPLIGLLRRWPDTFHGVDQGALIAGWERATFTAACGINHVRLYGGVTPDKPSTYMWPPRLKGLPDHHHRCHRCWTELGKMRPRTTFTKRDT